MNRNLGQRLIEWLKSLQFLLPAVITAVLVFAILPLTIPALADMPERLKLETTESASDETKATKKTEKKSEEEPEQAVGDYPDGVYTGSAQGYGGTVEVQVTVEGGQIVDVTILSATGETPAYLNRALAIIDQVYQKQTWEVDVISGATYTSNGILGAIQNALTGERVENEVPAATTPLAPSVQESFTEPVAYRDGTYTGSAQGFGGLITVSVTIKDGKIAKLNVVSAAGETPSYLSRAMTVVSRILKSGSPNVDVVSGATYTSNGIINATKRALNKAAVNGTEQDPIEEVTPPGEEPLPELPTPDIDETVMPTEALKDGVYTGTGEGYGGDIVVEVTVEGGRITSVEVLSAEDETPSYFERAKMLIPYIISTQSSDVDTVSGATLSSNGILEAVNQALNQALEHPSAPEKPSEPTTPSQPDLDVPNDDLGTGLYADGVYTATGWCSDGEDGYFNYELTVTVTVQDGQIVDISVLRGTDLSEYPEDNDRYLDWAMNGRTKGGTTYVGIPQQIITKQSANHIDAVSGATYSSDTIRDLAAEAIQPAKLPDVEEPDLNEPEEMPDQKPDETEKPAETPDEEQPDENEPEETPPETGGDSDSEKPTLTDGVYSASGICQDDEEFFCYELTVTATIQAGKITEISVTRGTDWSECPEDNDRYMDWALNGRTKSGKTYPGVPKQIVDAQSANHVDAVSGATYSSATIAELARQAIAQAGGTA